MLKGDSACLHSYN